MLQRTPKDLEPSGAVGWILIALIVAIGLAVWCVGWGPLQEFFTNLIFGAEADR